MTESLQSAKWEYEILERPSEILLIIFSKEESNVRGYLRLTSPEEVEEWLTILGKNCSKKE